jgi:hypothetical protein
MIAPEKGKAFGDPADFDAGSPGLEAQQSGGDSPSSLDRMANVGSQE